MHWRKGELSKRSEVAITRAIHLSSAWAMEYMQHTLSELKIYYYCLLYTFPPKSNPLAKGGAKPRHLQSHRSELSATSALFRLSCAIGVFRLGHDLTRAAPTRNAVKIALLRRRGATHRSAQRRWRRCDTPWANSFTAALLCSRGAWRCGSRGV